MNDLIMNDNNDNKPDAVKAQQPLPNLEDALLQVKYGQFHRRLILASLASTCATTTVSSTSSYLLPNAECDLHMDVIQKGLLNAGPFIGFIATTLLSVFFEDIFGRKKILIGGHAGMFILTILEASSQSYWSLLLMKILEGVLIIWCMAAMFTMVDEFTHVELRMRRAMLIVSFMPLCLIGLALIAWGLLPHSDWHFVIWKGYIELRSWNIYLYVCSVFSLCATILYCTIPESPVYLYWQGKENEALEVLKSVYSENTGNDKDMFPIKTLGLLRIPVANRPSMKTQRRRHLSLLKQLLQKPLVYSMALFSFLTFVTQLMYSAIRLWYPQISSVIGSYGEEHGDTDRFCVMMNHYTNKINMDMSNTTVSDVCVPTISGFETYINIIVVSLVMFFAINITGYLVQYVGHKLLMYLLFIICAVSSWALYLTSASYQVALVVAAICGCLQAILGLQQIVLTNLFPSFLRTEVLTIIILWNRIGGLLGVMLFPILLQVDCMVPYLSFSIVILCCAALVYFIPSKLILNITLIVCDDV